MKDKIAKLIDVKSIVTLALTAAFIFLACFKVIPQEFQTIFTVVISFYFGTQAAKTADK